MFDIYDQFEKTNTHIYIHIDIDKYNQNIYDDDDEKVKK